MRPEIRSSRTAMPIPAGLEGQVVYDLRVDFGVSPEEVRQRFDFYFDRFAVRAEVS